MTIEIKSSLDLIDYMLNQNVLESDKKSKSMLVAMNRADKDAMRKALNERKDANSRGGKKKNEDTIAMKAEIIAIFNTEKSQYIGKKNDAAMDYMKLYPLKFSTIRDYLKNL